MKLIEIANAGIISDAPRLSEVGVNILNFLLQIFGVIAIIAIVGSGILYLTSYGDEGRMQLAKKWLVWSIAGLIAGLGAVIIVRQIASFFG